MTDKNVSAQLESLLNELDEDSVNKMSDDEILEMRRALNPYGRTIEGSNNYLTFSYTDLRAEYQKKLITTGMIGFLNRMLDEWHVPDGVPVVSVYDYVKNPEKLDEFLESVPDKSVVQADVDLNKEWMAKRVIVKEFLEEMFQYNPDFHVKSAYVPSPLDNDRELLDTPAGHLAINQLKGDAQFQEDMAKYQKLMDAKKKSADKERSEAEEKMTDEEKIAAKAAAAVEEKALAESVVSQVREVTTNMIPPADFYHRYTYYAESNYEELRGIVQDIYGQPPDMETALNPYSWHETEEQADNFINKHKNEVITTIYKAHSGKWNMFGPFKKVRDTMRYFNDKTLVLEGIAKQIESDAKLGKQLMDKRIKIKKKKNIAEEGPDAESFAKWKAQNTTLKDLGAESYNSSSFASEDCPDDAIEVPVFRISNGGQSIEKTKFFTEAAAPTATAPE